MGQGYSSVAQSLLQNLHEIQGSIPSTVEKCVCTFIFIYKNTKEYYSFQND